ncbi:hypothetical protein VSAL_I0553 [Aliivibrio salmonicida LFI1238]|uniref:Uncharacterized protein n=1 Tax=Aliivibrio salmonicida (strain LFI1238) TaxID=316275 RepID=B6EMV9_ALISL|nr:hypothetical protein VSAL_I0553 [Aliivibrio salmonicida LFI1238]
MSQSLIVTANVYLANKVLFFTILTENLVSVDKSNCRTQTIGYVLYLFSYPK